MPWSKTKHKPTSKTRYITGAGYVKIFKPSHPNATYNGWILEHRWVMSNQLERPLTKVEFCHHRNGDKQDNRIENLQLCAASEHRKIHAPDRTCNKCGKPHVGLGLCKEHYREKYFARFQKPCSGGCGKMVDCWWRRNDKAPKCYRCRFPKTKCRVCGKKQHGHGYCRRHYWQWKLGRKIH